MKLNLAVNVVEEFRVNVALGMKRCINVGRSCI